MSIGKPDPGKARIKKSETLEVRIPHETKQAFLTACREDGTTASEVVREQVQTYLDARERPQPQEEKRTLVMKLPDNVRRYAPRVAAGGIAAIGLTALAVLPSAAAPDFKAQFARLDVNSDGVLSVEEFLGPKDGDAAGDERNVRIETRTITHSGDAKPDVSIAASATMKQDAFTFWLPEELGGSPADKPAGKPQAMKFVSRTEVKELKDGEPEAGAHVYTFSIDDIRKQEFDSIDGNKDGKVSLDEFKVQQTAMLSRGFEILDTDSDKSLSAEEYAKIVAPPMVKMNWSGDVDMPDPPKIDIPGIKPVSPEAIKAAFTRLDANRDGKLSLKEYLPPA